jgi:hypothetical protein
MLKALKNQDVSHALHEPDRPDCRVFQKKGNDLEALRPTVLDLDPGEDAFAIAAFCVGTLDLSGC